MRSYCLYAAIRCLVPPSGLCSGAFLNDMSREWHHDFVSFLCNAKHKTHKTMRKSFILIVARCNFLKIRLVNELSLHTVSPHAYLCKVPAVLEHLQISYSVNNSLPTGRVLRYSTILCSSVVSVISGEHESNFHNSSSLSHFK